MLRSGIIPARFASTRFPGKPLIRIGGLSMIERVYRQAEKSVLDHIIVATDDERIEKEVRNFGGEVVMTSSELTSGTDRCREALASLHHKPDIVVNIQGDEPFIDPKQINQVLSLFENPEVDIATLISPALSADEVLNPNRVKAVVSAAGKALYFSRQAVPYINGISKENWHSNHTFYIHLGIYGYRTSVLHELGKLMQSGLEKAESLEQLRWLENGYNIFTAITHERSDAVDTPEDLRALEKKFFL